MTARVISRGSTRGLLRSRSEEGHTRVTYVELFFDLVFVFAVTQLSHLLLGQLTVAGALETALLLMGVWWAWIYTSWITNWLDPDRTAVRLALFGLMLAGLLLAVSIPHAFTWQGWTFALAYAAIQVGRTLFMLWAIGRDDAGLTRVFQRILVWLAVSAAFWIAGGIAEGGTRTALWTTAIAIEYLSPSVGFWVPWLGRSATSDWNVAGEHLAERCALFVIIALGESILVIGATFAGLDFTAEIVVAFLASFVSSAAMWWIYFNIGAEAGSERIAASSDPGRLARSAYTYIHLFIIAGIIVCAVADELVLKHPSGHTSAATTSAVLGGPALFLLGNILFKRVTANRWALSHLIGLLLLASLVAVSAVLSPLLLGIAAALVLALVAIWETLSLTPQHDGAPFQE